MTSLEEKKFSIEQTLKNNKDLGKDKRRELLEILELIKYEEFELQKNMRSSITLFIVNI